MRPRFLPEARLKRIGTYDIEIAESVDCHPDKWRAAMRGDLGISSIALYDTATERCHIYCPTICIIEGIVRPATTEELYEAADHLNSCDVLVSWNGAGFDRRVIEGYLGVKLEAQQYDMLALVQAKIGKAKGWKLGQVAERTLGLFKTESGVHAPELFKAGRIGALIDYNISDVHLTRKLANFVYEFGYLPGPNGEQVVLPQLECMA